MNTLKRHRRNAQGLDRNTAERMFVGLAADDAPPDYAAVAAVLAAAAAPADGSSTAPGEYSALRAYRDAKYEGVPARAERRFQPWRTAAGRLAVFATAGALAIGGGVAAAATGSLPAPAQRVAHQILGGLGVPSDVTPDVIPANLEHPRGESDAPTAPGLTVRDLARTNAVSTTEVIPAEAAPAAATTTTTTDDENDENDHGEAVSSVARSVEPGPDHGAAVCFVASDGACMTDHRGEADSTEDETATEDSAKSHRSETGAEKSAKARQHAGDVADAAKEHRSQTGADNSAKSRQSDSGATNPARSHEDAADGADGED